MGSSLFASGNQEAKTEMADKPTELSIAVMGNYLGNEMGALKAEFELENPDLTIEAIHNVAANDWSDYFVKIRTLIAGGDSPDVMYVAIEGAQYLAAKNMAIPLDEYIANDPTFRDDYKDLHPKLQSAFELNGHVYGTVFGWNNVVTHFNLDMLEEVGLDVPSSDWDEEEFLKYAKALTREVDGQKVFGFSIPDFYFVTSAWLYNYGASFLNEDMTASALDTPEALAAFQMLYDLVYKYKYAPQPTADTANPIAMFTNGQVAMVLLGRWPLPSWKEADMNFDIQYLPNFGAQKVIFGSGAWVVSSQSKHPEEAYKLAKFLSSEYAQKSALKLDAIPTRISVMDEMLPQYAPENTMLYRESADIASPVQAPEAYPEIAQIFSRYFSLLMADEIAVEDCVLGMHNEINDVLKK
jgi:ABC-type glycerol-3-phosphate transport system substrate-binding protein